MAAPGLGSPGDHSAPSAPAYIRGGWLADRSVISSFSSYSTADSGYSSAVTIGSSRSADASLAEGSRETACQNSCVRLSIASGAGLCARFRDETAGLKIDRPSGEGELATLMLNLGASVRLFFDLLRSWTDCARARARAGALGISPVRDSCRPRVSISSSAAGGSNSCASLGVMGADGYGERGYDDSALSRLWLGRVRSRVLTNAAKRMVFVAVLLLTLAAGSLGERGSSKSVMIGDSWYARVRKGFGAAWSLKPSTEGEYTRSPHPGIVNGLGETEMGPRSYDPDERAVKVAMSCEGEGGKCTWGDLIACEVEGESFMEKLATWVNADDLGDNASGSGRLRMERIGPFLIAELALRPLRRIDCVWVAIGMRFGTSKVVKFSLLSLICWNEQCLGQQGNVDESFN
jgi:hypothetical protein